MEISMKLTPRMIQSIEILQKPLTALNESIELELKLKEIVKNEDKSKPLSDDALVEELAKQGIKLTRRTVTKYRKAMDIPSSRQRREK